jgi:prepilin-type N-terminal cleavage/methylation domain-containing protein
MKAWMDSSLKLRAGEPVREAFTLIELLVVISIIAVLASMLLPSLGRAKSKALSVACLNNVKQLGVALNLYTGDNAERFPPIQDRIPGGETSWRPFLYAAVGRNPRVFDCPAERIDQYSSAKPRPNAKPSPWVLGQFLPGEIEIPSGIGAVNVHWQFGGAQPPFGRPAGYENNLCRWGMVERPTQLILFGDGHSDVNGTWPSDRWWIWKEIGNANQPGFNRIAQGDKGSVRHQRRSNHVFADGSARLLDPGRIPCNTNECWWSAKSDPH